MDKVIVTSVTYNSSHFLRRMVEAVVSQSYGVIKMVVVDNASTEEHEQKNRILAEEYPALEIVKADKNLGGAGGFEKGIEYILERRYDFDWIWIMDDDAFPQQDCLEKLMKYKYLDHVGALAPLIYGVDLQQYQLYHHKTKNRYLNADYKVGSTLNDLQDITKIDTNAFVGPLVCRRAIKKVGIPNGALFIYGDDTEYMYRISRKFNVYLIKEAVINHRDIIEKEGEINPSSFWKEYYKYRNRMLFIDEFKSSTAVGMIGKLLVVKDVLRDMGVTMIHRKYAGYRALRMNCLLKSVKDGLCSVSGKTIDPAEFKKRVMEIRDEDKTECI